MLFSRVPLALLAACVGACLGGCPAEEPVEEPEEQVAPGWVLSRPYPDTLSLQDVAVLSPTRAYAVGTGGTVLRYDEGAWTREDVPDLDEGLRIESVSGVLDEESAAELVVAVGQAGLVLVRGDGGWQVIESGVTVDLFGVWARSLDDAFIVGDEGTILRWRDTGLVSMATEALQERQLPDGTIEQFAIPEALKAVAGYGESEVWAVGLAGAVYHFDGGRWWREDSRTSRPFTDVSTSAGVMATATEGIVFRRGGEGWDDSLRVPVPLYLQGVWASSWDDVFAVGMAGSVFHFDGSAWATTEIDDEAHLRSVDGVLIAPAADDAAVTRMVMVVGAGGRVLRGPAARPGDDQPATASAE